MITAKNVAQLPWVLWANRAWLIGLKALADSVINESASDSHLIPEFWFHASFSPLPRTIPRGCGLGQHVGFLLILLLLKPKFSPQWSDKLHVVISIFLILFRLALWLYGQFWRILEVLRRKCIFYLWMKGCINTSKVHLNITSGSSIFLSLVSGLMTCPLLRATTSKKQPHPRRLDCRKWSNSFC